MMSLSVYNSLQSSVHLSFISSLSIKIFPFLSFTAVVFDCHFLFTDLTSLYTSLDFLSPAHCSMFLHCCSNHSCLSFLADVLVSLHNFLYFLFISSDTFLFSFAFLFSLQVLTLHLKSILFLVVLLLELLPPPHPSILH